jgi:hypothetical protein
MTAKSLRELVPGSTVCVVGRGEAVPIHRHMFVKRLTKTMFVVSRIVAGNERETRYSFTDGREVQGRTVAAVKCQAQKS